MFDSVQYIRDICQQRKIPISQLEKDCGFSNGYLNPKKLRKIPYDRAQTIASYLGISVDIILTGRETEKAPTVSSERDILDEVDIGFYNGYRDLDEADKEVLRDMVRIMRERRAKKGD